MKNLILLIAITFLLSCEKEPMEEKVMRPFNSYYELCTTIVTENGIVTDKQTHFVSGEALVKQQNANFSYTNESTGNLIVVETTCYKDDCKNK